MANDADRTLVWPDGSIFRITRSSADTGGELLEMEWELPAHGWAPQPHVHPRLTEEYEVLEGSFDVLVGSEWRTLTKGNAASVPPGTVHTFRIGASPVRVRNVHRPALDFEPYVRRLCSAANQRNLGDLSGPRALLYIAVLGARVPAAFTGAGATPERSGAPVRGARAPARVPDRLTRSRYTTRRHPRHKNPC